MKKRPSVLAGIENRESDKFLRDFILDEGMKPVNFRGPDFGGHEDKGTDFFGSLV
jgi:hypothetical protein